MSNNTLAEYRSKHLRPGSTFYYCVRSLSPAIRQTLELFFMLYRELASIAELSREHAVARLRYEWWGEELQRWSLRQARHPLTRAWPLEGDFICTLPTLLQETRAQFGARLIPNYLGERDALKEYCANTAGVFAYVAAHLEHPHKTYPRRIFSSLGVGIELTRLLKHLAPLKAQGVGLVHFDTPGTLRDANLTDLFTLAQQNLKDTPALALSSRCNLVAHRIAKAQLNELQRNRAVLLTHKIDLTPIRKFWISWTAPLCRR